MGLHARIRFTAEQKAELWERWKNGQSVLAISRALDVTRRLYIAQEASAALAKERSAALARCRELGLGVGEIARELGVTEGAIRKAIKERDK